MKKTCLAGYSGHGYVVAEIVTLLHYTLIGYIDLEEKKSNPFKLKYFGDESKIDLSQFVQQDIHFALGVGDNKSRKNLFENLKRNKILIETLQHPRAVVSDLSSTGEGTVVMSSVVINPFAKIGNAVICNSGCIVEHECIIENYAHIGPGAVLAGDVLVGEGSFIGANAFVKQGLKIGKNATVGAGSVVINNIADNALVYGNPAKIKNV